MSPSNMCQEDLIPALHPANRVPEEGSRLGSVQATQELRRQAEEIFHQKAGQAAKKLEVMTIEKARLLLHELQVHQIELEMQNEELRLAQVELNSARSRYFDLYDLAPVGYCTISEKGLILESNLTAADLLTVSRGGLVKQPLTRFIFIEDQNIYYLFRKRLFATCEPQRCELRMVKNDGTVFWVQMETTVVKGLLTNSEQDSNEAFVSRIVLSDISKRKQSQDDNLKLEAMNRQYQKSESLGIMAGGIAHHFNNKLHALIMNLEMAFDSLPKDSGPLHYLRAARQEADKAADLCKMMLVYLGQTI